MHRRFVVAGALLALALAACGGGDGSNVRAAAESPPEATARQVCQGVAGEAEVYGRVDSVRAERSPAVDVAAWQEGRHGPAGPRVDSPFRQTDGAVTVCVFTGDFRAAVGPPPSAGEPGVDEKGRIYDRVTLLVDESGGVTLDSLSRSGTIAFETPADFKANRPSAVDTLTD